MQLYFTSDCRLTGVMMAVAPLDWQVSGSYFLIAHFHYVIVRLSAVLHFDAFYYWNPKMFGEDARRAAGQDYLLVVGDRIPSDV